MIRHPDYYLEGFMRDTNGIYSTSYIKNLIHIWEQYYIYLFDMNWKKQQDTWIIMNGLYKLRQHKIKFFIIPQFMYQEDFVDFEDYIADIHGELDPWINTQGPESIKARFHTDLETQRVLADRWYEFLQGKI
jgi:hypothetical protein